MKLLKRIYNFLKKKIGNSPSVDKETIKWIKEGLEYYDEHIKGFYENIK